MEILTGIISKIIEYTVEPVGRQVGYLIHYKRNFENLRSQSENLDAAKDRITQTVNEEERKGKIVHNDVQKWLAKAAEMIQEANKLLGDEGQAETKCFRGVCPNLVSYHQFSRNSAKLAKNIELHHDKKGFPCLTHEPPVEDICATPSEEYMPFESRTSMLKQIMEELKNPDTNMIGVYGLGGVGKTTLAKEVFRQVKEEKSFDDVVIILNVKEKKDMEIQKEIAAKLGMEVKESMANCLWSRIKDKKTLVILDDVLRRIDLEAVGLVVGRTCNLLLTSRDKEVLFYEMGTQKNFPLDLLCEQESLSLFEKRAGAVIKDNRIEKVAKELAKKCGGLPILVVAVASGLREGSLEEWKHTLTHFKNFEEKGLTEKGFLIIEWSYNRLHSEELKWLFLLCGIMAQSNNAFSLSDLLKYTIGLGLFKNVRTVEEARNALHASVKKLKDSCLLLDGYGDGSVRMHDVVRDVAVRIASRDQHVLSRAYTELDESPSKNCSLISLQRCAIPKLPDVPWECPELKFFLLRRSDDSLEIPCNFFEKMKELKVLDLTRLHFPSLPLSLQSLTNLQTLCLNMCVLGDIALVGKLTNLKILSLIQSQVKELPKEIGQLTRLQLLDLSYCSELVLIPAGVISSLTSLEDLRMGSFKEWEGGLNDGRSNASVSELKQLRQLTALVIHIPDAKLLPANMFSDTKLERYTIIIGDCWLRYPYYYATSSNMFSDTKLKLKLTTHSQFDQGIKLLLERCEDLELEGMVAANIISHILTNDSCKQLKKLHVQNSDEVTAVINSSHAFPNLELLSLDKLVNLETVCCGQIAQPFQKLRYLTLWNLPKLIGLSSKGSTSVVSTEAEEIVLENEIGGPTKLFMNGEVLMPNLTSLVVDDCGGLRFLFPSSMARSLVQLKNLTISNCQIMEEIVPTNESSEEDTDHNMFSQLQDLSLHHLPNLTRFCSARRSINFHSLEKLHLEDCSKLETFIFDPMSTNITINKATEEIRDSTENIGTDARYFLFDEKGNPFPNLERLYLNTEIWYEAPAELFINLKAIQFSCAQPPPFHFLQKLHNLEKLDVCGGPWKEIFVYEETSSGEIDAVGTTLPHIKNLSLKKMEELMHLGNDNSELIFPNLEILNVYHCGRLKNLTSSTISFHNLTTLHVGYCMGLKYLVTYSVAKCLHQLKTLEVWSCESITEIVAINGDEEDSGNNYEITFRSLQHLELLNLPSLRGFCSSGNCTVRVPSSNSLLSVYGCWIELKISPDGSLIQSGSRPERQQITEEVVEEEDDVNETFLLCYACVTNATSITAL
ncbi:hypothetical protein ACE6H2_009530 [Prunus campanulata]